MSTSDPRLDVPPADLDDGAEAPPSDASGPRRAVERALTRKRRKYADDVNRLVAAAFQVMRSNDTIDPKVSDILAEAGLSTTAFYRHFRTKDDLFLALLEHAGATTRSYLAHLLDGETDPVARISLWVRGMFDLIRTDALVAANRSLILAHGRLVERYTSDIARNTAALVAPLAGAVADARAAAGIPAGEPVTDALLTHRLVYGVIADHAAERRTADPREVDAVVSYALRALLGDAGPGTG